MEPNTRKSTTQMIYSGTMTALTERTQATESETSWSDVTLTHKATVCVTMTHGNGNPETPIRLYNTTDDEFLQFR